MNSTYRERRKELLAENWPRPSAKVSDEAVEAAARALYACEMRRAEHTQRVLEDAAGRQLPGARERESYEEHADTTWRKDALAALTAALPHLTACVGGDVRRLVIAVRVGAFEDQGRTAIQELDDASEAFADRIPWDDEPYDGLGRCGECGHVHSPRKACPAAPTPEANRG